MILFVAIAILLAILLRALFAALQRKPRVVLRAPQRKVPEPPNGLTRAAPRWDHYHGPAYVRRETPGVAQKLAAWHATPAPPASLPPGLALIDPVPRPGMADPARAPTGEQRATGD